MAEIGMTAADLSIVADKAASVIEWQSCPGTPSKERFIEAILTADKIGQTA